MGLTLTTVGKAHLSEHTSEIIVGEKFTISWWAVFGALVLAIAPVLLFQGLTVAKRDHTKEQEVLGPLLNGILTLYFSYGLLKNWGDNLPVLRTEGFMPGLKRITGTPYTVTALLELPLTVGVALSVAVIMADLTKKVPWMEKANPLPFTWVLFSFGTTFGSSANKIVKFFLRIIESSVNELKFLLTGRPLKRHFAMTYQRRVKEEYVNYFLTTARDLSLDRELLLQADLSDVESVFALIEYFRRTERSGLCSEQRSLCVLKQIVSTASVVIGDVALLGALMLAWFSLAGNFRDLFVQYHNSFWLIFPVFTQMAFNADIMADILSALFESFKKITLTFNAMLTSWPHWLMFAMVGGSFYLASQTTAPTRMTAETYNFDDFVLGCVEAGTTGINGYCAALLLNKLVAMLAARVGTEKTFFKNDAILTRFTGQCQKLSPENFEASAALLQVHSATATRKYLLTRLFADDVLVFALGLSLRFGVDFGSEIFLSPLSVFKVLTIGLYWAPIFPVAFLAAAIKFYFLSILNISFTENALEMPLIAANRKPVAGSVSSARSSVNGAVEHVERERTFSLQACVRESFFVAVRATWNASFMELSARILLTTLFEDYPLSGKMIGLFSIVIAGIAAAHDFSKATDPFEKALQTFRH